MKQPRKTIAAHAIPFEHKRKRFQPGSDPEEQCEQRHPRLSYLQALTDPHQRLLEEQLTPTLHTIALLKGQIGKESRELAADRSRLEELRKNARAEETFRNRLNQKVRHRFLLGSKKGGRHS
jgi:hypothetical protein